MQRTGGQASDISYASHQYRSATLWLCAFGRVDRDPRLAALAAVAGAGFVYCQPAPPSMLVLAAALVVCLIRFPGRALIAVFLISAAWASLLAQQQLHDRLPAARSGEIVEVVGHVTDLPVHDAIRTRFELVRGQAPRHLRLSWYNDAPSLLPGDCLRLTAKLKTPHGADNPGTFDYEAWLWRQGIDATGYVKTGTLCNRPGPGAGIDRARAAALQRMDAILGDAPMRGIVEALTLGAREAITDAQWDVLRATGTSHLVAISGLHVGLIAAWLFFIAQWLALRLAPNVPARLIAAGVAFAGAASYALLAGFALPTQRALVMVAVGLFAVASMRRIALDRMLAFAAIAVIAWQPAAVIAPGFWLSFGAVAWLLYLSRFVGRSRWLAFGVLQLGLVAGLMPVTLWFFGQASLISPLANAVLIPLAGVLVPGLLLVTVLALALPAIGAPLLVGVAQLLGMGWPLLAAAAHWRLSSIHLAVPGVSALLLALAGIAILAMPRGLPGRWLAIVFIVPAVIGWRPAGTRIAQGAYRVTVIDVGQGLANVVRTRRHTLIFDTGPAYRSGFNAGDAFVVPYLRHVGRSRVDTLVVSHTDLDHIGGAQAIENALTVVVRRGARSQRPCRAGQHWRWDGVVFEFLYPSPRDAADAQKSNQRSCVLRISGRGGTTLLTGDIEADVERTLVERDPAALAADVLVVAHHGSASSTSPAFVDAVAPGYALISSGWHNRWGFPASAVVARLRAAGSRIANTATGGALTIDVAADDAPIELGRWRQTRRRFWQAP